MSWATTEILLLRHGESEGNATGRFGGHGPTPLTALGRRQAEAAAAAIAAEPVDAIYASDLVRAVETAAPLARLTGRPVVERAELRERSVGVLTGITFEEAKAKHPEVWAALLARDVDYTPPGGESHRACSARVGALFAEVVAKHAGQRVVLVSHGVAIDHLMRHVMGTAGEPVLRYLLHVDNAAIHRVQRRGEAGLWRVMAMNERTHLVGIGEGET